MEANIFLTYILPLTLARVLIRPKISRSCLEFGKIRVNEVSNGSGLAMKILVCTLDLSNHAAWQNPRIDRLEGAFSLV